MHRNIRQMPVDATDNSLAKYGTTGSGSSQFATERLAGLFILLALGAGILAVNSPAQDLYFYVHHVTVHIGIASLISKEPLIFWVNDGFMAFFFLLAGMEIKHELVEGHLSTFRHALLPALCAAGGIIAPALIYSALSWGHRQAATGWAIPTATDVVLALCAISLVGRCVPASLRAFLMAIAIFDDIGAVAIVGLFYGDGIAIWPLVGAILAALALLVLCRLTVMRIWPYAVAGVALWLCLLGAGVEAALAGLFIGLAVPLKKNDHRPLYAATEQVRPWVWFVVLPLFAFFNSGIVLNMSMFDDVLAPPSLGIILGLSLGKPLGIVSVAALAVRFKIGRLPAGLGWSQVLGAGFIAGVGFTMSLFVAALAFASPAMLASAKLAVLLASLASATTGLAFLQLVHYRMRTTA